MNFEKFINEYLNFIKLKRKEITYLTHIDRINKHIIPYFKNKNIEDISVSDILSWQNKIDNLGFKFNYKSAIFYSLSSFFNYLEKFHNVDNIVRKVGNFRNDEIEENKSVWTVEDFNKFISAVNEKKYKIFFEILYFTGLRKGELLALNVSDIDFKNSTITIDKTITRTHKINTPKTKTSNRIISIDKKLNQDIKEYVETSNLQKNLFDFSFTQIKRKKDFYCKKANVKQIRIHDFRHSHAILLYQNNVPVDEIKYRLGHSKLSITLDTYLKYLPKNEKRVIKTLNSIHFT